MDQYNEEDKDKEKHKDKDSLMKKTLARRRAKVNISMKIEMGDFYEYDGAVWVFGEVN